MPIYQQKTTQGTDHLWLAGNEEIPKENGNHSRDCVTYSLNSLKGGYIGDYIGKYYKDY